MTDCIENRRRYSRISPDDNFSVMVQHTNNGDREYYEGIIEDISYDGMFIEIDHHPFPKGCMVGIQFKTKIEKDERPVTAKVMIRWTRKWKRPHGMGIDFIEFDGLGSTPFEEWFKNHFRQE